MKKLIKIMIISIVMLSLVVFNYTFHKEDNNAKLNGLLCNNYFTEIVKWEDETHIYYIAYANDTKVKYFICKGTYRFGITPLYNADGTLQIYEGE